MMCRKVSKSHIRIFTRIKNLLCILDYYTVYIYPTLSLQLAGKIFKIEILNKKPLGSLFFGGGGVQGKV